MDDPKVIEFKSRVKRRFGQIILLLITITTYGTLGIYVLEGASLFDSFYMAVITMSTVGFAETVPLSISGRIFAVTIIFAGLVGSGVSVGLLLNLIFEETLLQFFKGKRMEKQINKLDGHIIVCGYGSTGMGIVEELLEQNRQVVIVDEKDQNISHHSCYFLQGDARKDDVLEKAGIRHARGLATTLTEDADNVFVVLTARAINKDLNIVSRFKDDDTEKKLFTAGADHVVSPYRMGGLRLAMALTNPAFLSVLDASFKKSGRRVHFSQIKVPEDSLIRGRLLRDSRIREHSLGALIVEVIETNGNAIFNPSPDYRMDNVDHLLVLGDDEQIKSMKIYLQDSSPD